MGILRDAIGSALGADQVKNGFNGPKLPFSKSNIPSRYSSSSPSPSSRPSSSPSPDPRWVGHSDDYRKSQDYIYPEQSSPYPFNSPPPYEYDRIHGRIAARSDLYQPQPNDTRYLSPNPPPRNNYPTTFQPIALPQISHGEGSPFLRGYSSTLHNFGIGEREFLEVVDTINAAMIPNPENQIFQKAAGIAGWFVPGGAAIGLMAGQLGVGLGAKFGHSALLDKILSKANLEIFIPRGLEICIGKTKDLNSLLSISHLPGRSQYSSSYSPTPSPSGSQSFLADLSPEARLASYGPLLAPLTRTLPPVQNGPGQRNDPIAMLGRGLSEKSNRKKMKKAREDLAEGKGKKAERVEGGLLWIMVKEAAPESVEFWKGRMRESERKLEEGSTRMGDA